MGKRKAPPHLNPSKARKRTKKAKAIRLACKSKQDDENKENICVERASTLEIPNTTVEVYDKISRNSDVSYSSDEGECMTLEVTAQVHYETKNMNVLNVSESAEDGRDGNKCFIAQGEIVTEEFTSQNAFYQKQTPAVGKVVVVEPTITTEIDREHTPPETLHEFSFISEQDYDDINQYDLYYEADKEPQKIASVISGNRIVNLGHVLNWSTTLQYDHSKICTLGRLFVKEEVRWGIGLVSEIVFRCTMCHKEYSYFTEDLQNKRSKINYGAVWGTLAIGSTYGHLEEFLATMDIPPLTLYKFKQIENELASVWKDSLYQNMEENGKEERAKALELGHIDSDGVPYVTVYLDGGWSKRSYGHSYNASSGTAIIIGQHTHKLLFLGVRNKYCTICARAANKQTPPGQHICYKNWSGSSSAMEADIVVEGFCKSEEMHGIRYKQFIADGDSSVHAKIRQCVPYGNEVQKIECKNHVLKNYGKALRTIKKNNNVDIRARKLLTAKIIAKLENRIQHCIIDNALGDVEYLKKDISNSPLHVFGDHRKCRDIYCEEIGRVDQEAINSLNSSGLLLHIKGALDGVLRKAHKLISNETNNRAELYMAILARFTAGKRLNLTQRGSFETRSHLAGLRYDKGVSWHHNSWKALLGESPGSNFKKYIENQMHSREQKTSYRQSTKEHDSKRKDTPLEDRSNEQIKSRQPNLDYGPRAEEAELTEEEFNSEIQRKLAELQISGKDEQERIAEETVGQFDSNIYINWRKHRLTASNFGQVIKRQLTTPCHNLVKQILKLTDNKSSRAMEYGKNNESMVRARFSQEYNINVRTSGLFIDISRGYLAASPDGLIGKDGLIEIKCLYKIQQMGQTLKNAVEKKQVPCLEINSDGNMILKRSHNYYFQIQGQLNITQRDYCEFIVYSGDNNPLFVERIKKDQTFWLEKMLPKLEKFYMDCILPEIVRGNLQKGKPCVDPPYIKEAIRKKEQKSKN